MAAEEKEVYNAEFLMHKANYYREKMHVEVGMRIGRRMGIRDFVTLCNPARHSMSPRFISTLKCLC